MSTLKTKILNYRIDDSHYLADEIFELEQLGYTQGNMAMNTDYIVVIMNPPVQHHIAKTILREDNIPLPPNKDPNRKTSI